MVKHSHPGKRSHEYELGHSDREIKRLASQAQLVDPITRRFFQDAGVKSGMRVLDIGSGAGDVAFLAAELVGPGGEVVGTDRSEVAVSNATSRAEERSLANVSFRQGDASELSFESKFDAIVGRYVLMFNSDPVSMLRAILRHLKPGGIVVFHEPDWSAVRSSPPAPLFDSCCDWIVQTFRKVGTNPSMGLQLFATFVGAGLPAPTMGLSALVGGGADRLNGVDLIGELTITMAPVMEQMGVATVAEIEPHSLVERMRKQVADNGSVVVGRYEIGAWSRLLS